MLFERTLVNYANRKLQGIPQFAGRVGGIELQPMRGAYALQNVRVARAGATSNAEFLEVRSAAARLSWTALLRRVLAVRLEVDGYSLRLVAGVRTFDRQRELDARLAAKGKALVPVRVDEVVLREGTLRLSVGDGSPVELSAERVGIVGRNLTNREHLRSERYASWEVRADFMGSAPVSARLRTNLLSSKPSFEIKGGIRDLALPVLNDFLHARANLDIAEGSFAANLDLALHEGAISGYVESFFTDLRLSRWNEGKPWSPFKRLRHGLFAKSIELLEDDRQTLAMRIPIEGRLEDMKIDLPSAVVSVLSNAFLQSLEPGLAHVIERSEGPRGRGSRERRPESEQGPHP